MSSSSCSTSDRPIKARQQPGIVWATAYCVIAIVAAAACGARTKSITGALVDVQAISLTEIREFSIETPGKARLTFTVRGDVGFSASHLREHMVTGLPVKVSYIDESGRLVALHIEDAP